MGKITLITGGSRSGKSAFAQKLAEQEAGAKLFIATCPVTDEEMAVRIKRHIADRQAGGWETVEEEVDLAHQIAASRGYAVILVDCLTLWVNNLLYHAGLKNMTLDENDIAARARSLVKNASEQPGSVLLVTNEVGLGIVPENETARLYRDLVGRCNQTVAAAADSVYLVSCGLPIQLKGSDDAF